MKACRKCQIDKPLTNYSIDRSARDGLRSACKACDVAAVMARRAKDVDADKERKRAWRERNQQYIANARAEYAAKNPDAHKNYYAKNRDAALEKSKAWNVRNKEKRASWEASRRAATKQQTPKLANEQSILEIYKRAADMRAKGISVQVDHIVPLNSPLVSGLHCEQNMQILDSSLNASKKNYHWPDMYI